MIGLAAPLVLLSAPRAIASDFEACTRSLIEAGIDGSTAAGDCGQALHPTDLSRCVVDITKDTDLDVAQTLVACQSDRRPQELAALTNALLSGDPLPALAGVGAISTLPEAANSTTTTATPAGAPVGPRSHG